MAVQYGKVRRDKGDRWYIELPGKIRIFCDKEHKTFYSRQHAEFTLNLIRGEVFSNPPTFDPDFYAKRRKSELSFENYARTWLKMCELKVKKNQLSRVHYRHLRHGVEQRFIPYFEEMDIRNIRGKHIRAFQLSLDLAPKTLFNLMATLHKLFNDAKEDEIIADVPNFPDRLKASDLPEPDWKWADEETQEKIFAELQADDLFFILFQATHGTRTGETRALQHQDIDLQNDVVTICRAFSEKDLRHTKTKRIRRIPLDATWKALYLERAVPFDKTSFVFTRKGQPYEAKFMWRRWTGACKKAGVSGLDLYSGTRHSLASQAANRGVSIYLIAKFLGHTDTRTTQRYAHLEAGPLKQVQRKASVIAIASKLAVNGKSNE